MSGQKGQNGPHSLKCSKCKLMRDEHGNATIGELVRTGNTRMQTRSGKPPVLAHELQCLTCGHAGWYTHRRATDKPLLSAHITQASWAQRQWAHARATKAAETVREKGRQAARAGLSINTCPYPDTRKVDGRLTFSRHWAKCWRSGYQEIEHGKNNAARERKA